MAELATIARPYAEALFKSVPAGESAAITGQLDALAQVAADEQLKSLADNPSVAVEQVFAVVDAAVGKALDAALDRRLQNLLRLLLENGRLSALPELVVQFKALVNTRRGAADATLYTAFPIDPAQWPGMVATLEQRFGSQLNLQVQIDPELIGGIRVVVGDEVLDTSVKARLEQMKAALAA